MEGNAVCRQSEKSSAVLERSLLSRYLYLVHEKSVSVWCLSFMVTFTAVATAATEPLRAGVSRIDLTPPAEMKAALGGYGARMSKPAVGVHDSVWAKALVLSQGDRRCAVVTADVLAFPHKFKAAVVERVSPEGWSTDQILLLPSHSHTSIDMMALHPDNVFGIPQVGVFQQALFDHTVARIGQAIREAAQKLDPVEVGSLTVSLPDRNRNRRGGTAHDPELVVTRVDRVSGIPLAVLVNWTAHPTFMDDSDMMFSGDWPGHLQRTVEALVGRGVTALFYSGAEGDQSPIPPAIGGSNWERAERYGREMGVEIWRVWEQIRPRVTETLRFVTVPVALPKRQWHADFMKTGGAEYGLNEPSMQEFVNRLLPTQSHCTAFRLGDLIILGVPGELAGELGLQVKRQARQLTGSANVTIGGLADEWISYILPAAEYRRGGYEASMSFYGETLGETLVDAMGRAAEGLGKRRSTRP